MPDLLTLSGWIIGTIGTILGAISFGYAIYSEQRRKRLTDLIRANNWFMLVKASNSNGHVQRAIELYKKEHINDSNIDLLINLGMGDAFGQEVFKEAIHQIQLHEPSFTSEDIDYWHECGKLSREHANLFKKFVVEKSSIPSPPKA